jgi:hypothetical protein
MKIIQIVTGVIIILLLNSCNPQKYCAKRFPPSIVEIEKTNTKEILRDTSIYIPGDTVKIIDTIPCPELINKSIIKKSGRATVKFNIKDNKITAEALCDSLEKVIQLKDKEITILKDRKEIQIIPKEYIPKYFLYSGILLPIVLLLYFIIKRFNNGFFKL